MNFLKFSILIFEELDLEIFLCLKLVYECLKMGGIYFFVLNLVNEVLVSEFLEDKIGFYDILYYIEKILEVYSSISELILEEILEIDRWSRVYVVNLIKK